MGFPGIHDPQEMFYDKGALVGTQRTPATSHVEGAKVAGHSVSGFNAIRSSDLRQLLPVNGG